MENNQFRIEHDTPSPFVVDDIASILRESFGIDIIIIKEGDGFMEYEIIKNENN